MGPLSRRGVALISVLLIGMLLFVLTLAFLTKQRLEHQSVSYQLQEARARALAQAGLEEVLVKLDKDYNFPPPRRTRAVALRLHRGLQGSRRQAQRALFRED